MSDPMSRLLSIMATLRNPLTGCDWDKAQTFKTIAPYTIEEAYEVSDAIDRGAMNELREELGDLLFQVVFHSQIACEQGAFAFADVADAISDKMERRHPHIFGDGKGEMTEGRWEALKEAERAQKGSDSALDGVAHTLPALLRAEKLQKRAARTGFDWPDTHGPADKVREEMAELANAPIDEREEEAGDLLFAAVNLVRAFGIAPETALKNANRKFERRFRAMETKTDGAFATLDTGQKEALWVAVKRDEKSAQAPPNRDPNSGS
ncbi:nucleoside triphosphate pyrophosphohydrolase [Pontixanthobacter sp.]|uniref:nucleoside triphosphate pyrophosphohydrolase n=1 Tax=Pontixanthobacter sp. TaxID=2792078 RepID=UPI003C7BF49F